MNVNKFYIDIFDSYLESPIYVHNYFKYLDMENVNIRKKVFKNYYFFFFLRTLNYIEKFFSSLPLWILISKKVMFIFIDISYSLFFFHNILYNDFFKICHFA